MAPKKNIRLVVAGASGRMGLRIMDLARRDTRFRLVAGLERPGSPRALLGLQGVTPLVTELGPVLDQTDAVIDFSSPTATLRTAEQTAAARRALVIGTTGHTPKTLRRLKELARRIPIVFSPNMSVGVNVLFQLLKQAASTLAHYDIEIVEAHHNLKKDAPSGTAMKLAQVAAEASQRSSKDFVYGREGLVGARKKKEIGVLAVRAGDIVGDHTIYLAGPGERLELTHRAHSRDAFASGALEAAYWVAKRRPGLYTMQDVLKI